VLEEEFALSNTTCLINSMKIDIVAVRMDPGLNVNSIPVDCI